MANSIPFRSKNTQRPKRQTPMMYKFTFTYYETVMDWSHDKPANVRTIESQNIPAACELFHESIHKIYPNYYISNIGVLPMIPGVSRAEQPTE